MFGMVLRGAPCRGIYRQESIECSAPRAIAINGRCTRRALVRRGHMAVEQIMRGMEASGHECTILTAPWQYQQCLVPVHCFL